MGVTVRSNKVILYTGGKSIIGCWSYWWCQDFEESKSESLIMTWKNIENEFYGMNNIC